MTCCLQGGSRALWAHEAHEEQCSAPWGLVSLMLCRVHGLGPRRPGEISSFKKFIHQARCSCIKLAMLLEHLSLLTPVFHHHHQTDPIHNVPGIRSCSGFSPDGYILQTESGLVSEWHFPPFQQGPVLIVLTALDTHYWMSNIETGCPESLGKLLGCLQVLRTDVVQASFGFWRALKELLLLDDLVLPYDKLLLCPAASPQPGNDAQSRHIQGC